MFGPVHHKDGCRCWDCEPQRWRGERHRRLLRLLRREREVYDAQNSATGVYDLLPYLAQGLGVAWLGSLVQVDDPSPNVMPADCGTQRVATLKRNDPGSAT
jgi:hypothetical protein